MKRTGSALLAAAAALALTLTPPALARPRGPHGPHGPGGLGLGPGGHGPGPGGGFLLGMAVERLDLTGDQRAEIHDLLSAHRAEAAPTHERLRSLRHELAGAGLGGEVDEAAIRDLAAELGELEASLALGRARALASIRELLTPDQLAELRDLRERVRERRGIFR